MPKPDEMVIRAAWLYYVEHQNQQQIAATLAVSRPTVSRLLQRARDSGVVEIRMRATLPEVAHQERALLAAYPELSAATVAPVSSAGARVVVAKAAARVLEEMVAGGVKNIAVGWGRTLGELANRVHLSESPEVTIIDAVGHAPEIPGPTSIEVSGTLAARLSAKVVHLPAPALVRPASAGRAILGTAQVKNALQRARNAEAAVVTIGAVTPDSPLQRIGLLTPEEWQRFSDAGVVGDVVGHFLDRNGEEIEMLDAKWICITLDDLREKDRVVGMVAGPEKATMTNLAIRAGLITHLITDSAAASAILAVAETTPTPTPSVTT